MTHAPLPPPPGAPQLSGPAAFNRSLADARRASVLLWVLGGLSILAALIIFSAASADPKQLADQLIATAPPDARQQLQQMDLSRFVRGFIAVIGGLALFIGVSLILSGFPVRKGRIAGTIYALVIVSLCCLWWVFNILTGVIHVLGGALVGIAEILFAGSIAFVFALCAFWLVRSIRTAVMTSRYRMMTARQITYPPGYASGYGVSTSSQIPPPPGSSAG